MIGGRSGRLSHNLEKRKTFSVYGRKFIKTNLNLSGVFLSSVEIILYFVSYSKFVEARYIMENFDCTIMPDKEKIKFDVDAIVEIRINIVKSQHEAKP